MQDKYSCNAYASWVRIRPTESDDMGENEVRNSIIDYTFTAEEARVIRAAVLQFVVEESKAVKHLERIQCSGMADAINKDVQIAERILKLI